MSSNLNLLFPTKINRHPYNLQFLPSYLKNKKFLLILQLIFISRKNKKKMRWEFFIFPVICTDGEKKKFSANRIKNRSVGEATSKTKNEPLTRKAMDWGGGGFSIQFFKSLSTEMNNLAFSFFVFSFPFLPLLTSVFQYVAFFFFPFLSPLLYWYSVTRILFF